MTSKMLLAAIQPNEQIYFITSKVDELDGVVVRDQEVVYVPFWSYINNNAGVITRLKGNEFLDTLWDGGQALKSDEWNEKFINRTNPFTESDLKPVAKLLLDVPRERKPEVEQDLSVFETKALGDVPSVRSTMRSGGKRRLRTGVRRGRLALEPYDPDARDGDNDGIVQEGTAWERPASARILDSRGTEIRRGQQASARPTGIRVVDRDGNDIDYKPTYEGGRAGTIGGSEVPRPRPSVKPPEKLTPPKKAAAKKPAKPTRESPLADHGARSLRERGLQSAREQYRAAVTPPEPEMIQTERNADTPDVLPEAVPADAVTYYHGTRRQNVDAIVANGLVVSQPGGGDPDIDEDEFGGRGSGVYVTTNLDEALDYGNEVFAVLLSPDEVDGYVVDNSDQFTSRSIPASRVRLVTNIEAEKRRMELEQEQLDYRGRAPEGWTPPKVEDIVAVPDNPEFHNVTRLMENGSGNPEWTKFQKWAEQYGITVRGTPVKWDDERIPQTLYHVSPAIKKIRDDGVLKAGGEGGLGGDPNDRIVSMTTSRSTAQQLLSDMRLVRDVGRADTPEDVVAAISSDAEKNGVTLSDRAINDLNSYAERNPVDALNAYFWNRQTAGGPDNPLFVDLNGTMQKFKSLDDDDFGIVEVDRNNLNNGALITDFDLGQGGLDEIRSYGDVKIDPEKIQTPEREETPDVPSVSPALPYTPAKRIDLGVVKFRAEEVKSELSASNSLFMDNLSDEEILQIAEHLGIEVPNNVALAARGAIDEYLIEKEIEIIVRQMNETRKEDIYVAVTPDVLVKILKDRRILSQFESGTSGGLFSPETRRSFEYYNMGIPETLEDKLRPIYGFQLSEDQLGLPVTSSPAAQQYGNIVIKLKKDVRGRTTMTGGDSLDNELVAIPVDGEVSESRVLSATGQSFIWDATEIAEEALMEEVFGDLNFGSGETTPPFRYNEVQVHGGVTLDMIEEVIYPSGGYYEDKIREAIIEALEEARIKHTEDW